MINDGDYELFQELVSLSEYLFPFVKENVLKRLEKSVCKANFKNLYKFTNCYSPDYDKVFATAFKYFGENEDKEKMLEYIKNGSLAQKTYAARYFELSKDIFAIRELIANAFSENEYLADACAAALGALNELKSYDIALAKLNSGDDFEALSGLNFFVSYAKNPPMDDIFNALKLSGMPENFAGKIVYLKPLTQLLQENFENALFVLDNILNGLGEILPLSEIFNFELFDALSYLSEINNPDHLSRISVLLLRAKYKFEMFSENDEYTFDEDKNTKNEIEEINKFLNSLDKNFWNYLKQNVVQELSQDKNRIISALNIIKDYNISFAVPQILETIYENEDETILCVAFDVLKTLKGLSYINKEEALSKFNNPNIKAIVESYYG